MCVCERTYVCVYVCGGWHWMPSSAALIFWELHLLLTLETRWLICAAMLDFFVAPEDLTSDYFTHWAIFSVYIFSSALKKQCHHPHPQFCFLSNHVHIPELWTQDFVDNASCFLLFRYFFQGRRGVTSLFKLTIVITTCCDCWLG